NEQAKSYRLCGQQKRRRRKGLLASGRCRMAAQERRRVRCRDLPANLGVGPHRLHGAERRQGGNIRAVEVTKLGQGCANTSAPFCPPIRSNQKGRKAMKITIALPIKAKFDLGQVVSTPGALKVCSIDHLTECLARHVSGDWGV